MRALLALCCLCFISQLEADNLLFNIKGKSLDQSGIVEFTSLSFEGNKITGVYQKRPTNKAFDEKIDGEGQYVLPGLIDAHGHVLAYGELLNQVDLSGSGSIAEVKQRIQQYLEKTDLPTHSWLLGRGWNQELWPNKNFPTADDLNGISNHPIALSRIDGHALWLNTKALQLSGIKPDTLAPPGGEIIKFHSGDPSGILIDNAMNLTFSVIPRPSDNDIEHTMVKSLQKLASLGLTSVHDAGISYQVARAYQTLAQAKKLPIRVYAMLDITDISNRKLLKQGPFLSEDNMLAIKSVKISSDGALGSRGAALHQDYSDLPGYKGLLLHQPKGLTKLVNLAMEKGFQVNTHAIGDRANTLVLDTYQAAIKVHKSSQLRHRIEHAQVIQLSELGRLADIGIVASLQPTHATSDKNMAEDRLGSSRIKGAYAWNTLLKNNTAIAAGSDFPVEPAEPFFGLHAAVTRQDRQNLPAKGWYSNEKLSRQQALQAFTLGAAYSAHQEKLLGSIEVGKQADFILVDQDYFSVAAEDIWKITPQQTWVAGKRVH